ncbi:MAG: hypothetical protein WC986_13630 [Elusimicrobiota bacterium]|jgi:hypothetical protein
MASSPIRIIDLSSADSPAAGDQVPIYSSANGDARRASLTALKAFFNAGVSASDDKATQYSAPSASPFTVAVTDSSASAWLVLTPTGTLAAGTITLPAVANCVDRQEILVNCTQVVTALTVAGNGATVTGAPTALAANGFFLLRFDAVTDTWYRVG